MPHTLWLILLGCLLIGYLVLDGATFGVGMLRLRLARDEDERRLLLNAVGPFFLGNEVWIVATVGLLFGAFPDLEGSLLTAFYPLVVMIVGGLIARDAGMWFRSRRENARWRSGWDGLIAVASLVLAMGWGLLLGNLVQGVPSGHTVPLGAALFDPYALLCGLTFVAMTACHGAVFIVMRSRGPLSARAARTARRLAIPTAVGLAASVGFGFVSAGAVDRPAVAAVVALAALIPLLTARRLTCGARRATAFGCTATSVAVPVIALGTGLASTLQAMTATAGTLAVLGVFLMAVIPIMAAGQVWLWCTFRGPVGSASPMYF